MRNEQVGHSMNKGEKMELGWKKSRKENNKGEKVIKPKDLEKLME
jgi:hypothetical protein